MLDSCINNIFEPGNIATDSGAITIPHYAINAAIEEAVTAADHASVPTVWSAAVVETTTAATAQDAAVGAAPVRSRMLQDVMINSAVSRAANANGTMVNL